MTRRKYATAEERKEARRQQNRERLALIRALLEEHHTALVTKHPPVTPPPAPLHSGVPEIRRAEARKVVIRTLVRYHYDEVKAELDAYRLVRESVE